MIKFMQHKHNALLAKTIMGSFLFFISLPVLCTPVPQKKGESASMNIHMTGTVVVTETCEIVDPINVEFNDVYVEELDNKEYKKKANYRVKCSAGAKDKTIDVRISGFSEKYDPSLFSTDVNGLSIKVLNDGKQVNPGDTTTLYTDNSSLLDIELVKQNGVSLPEKDFNSVIVLTSKLD